jgi:ABC-2 type transport system permease protein
MSTAGAQPDPVGTRVAPGSGFAGTGRLFRLALRRDRIVATVWILGLFLYAYSQAASIISLYPTQADLDRLAATAEGIGANPAVVAVQGPAYDAHTYGGATAWQLVTPWVFLIGLMSLFLVTRHTRQEEETGRAELVSAGVVGRHAWMAAALLWVLAVGVVLAAVTVLSFIAMGLPAAGTVWLVVDCALGGLALAGVAAITAQVTQYQRAANGMAFAVLGVAFLLRAIGDSAPALSWLSWLSPIGWAERFRPFAGERWWVLLLPAALLLVLLAAVAGLQVRRDQGAGVLPVRPGPATAPPRLRSPLALAWRLQRGALLGWAIGVGIAGLSFGAIAQDMVQAANQDPETAKMLSRLGGSGSIADIFLAAILSWLGMLAAAYAVQAVLRLRAEETELRAEQVLATAVPRTGWAGSHLLVAALGSAVLLVTGGLIAGIAHGLRAGDLGGQLPRVLGGALVQLPAVWVVAGIGAALFGVLPRLVAGGTWAILGIVLSITTFGELLGLDQWALDLSPFDHLPKVPAAAFTATPLAWLVALAVALAAVGLAGFRRRDLG